MIIHKIQNQMKERSHGRKEQVPKFYTRTLLEQLAMMSTNPVGAEFAFQWIQMSRTQASWFNNLSEEENISLVESNLKKM